MATLPTPHGAFYLRRTICCSVKTIRSHVIAGMTLFILHLAPLHAALSPLELQLQSTVKHSSKERVVLLRQLVEINSGTTNLSGVYEVGKIAEHTLSQLGFSTTWIQEPPSMQRAATLVAYHPGTKGKKLVLIGHLDTVFSVDSPFQHFKLKQYSAKGPGTLDDKGGLVVMF